MSNSTKKVSDVVAWAAPFVSFMPLSIGNNTEPALSSANVIKQTILGPPFAWRWNREVLTFTCIPGVQDYTNSGSWTSYANAGAWVSLHAFPLAASVIDSNGN